jgi:ketosteroid isomerase-like protein
LRVTRIVLLVFILLTSRAAAIEVTPQNQIESLETALKTGDARGAIDLFDPATPSFAEIKNGIQALSSLPNTTCTIAIERTRQEGDSIRFETDWSLQTYSVQNGPLLDRRDKVTITLRKRGESWRITAFSPVSSIFPPDDGVFSRIAKLASDLNEKDQFGAVGAFDSQMKEYGEIDNDIDALLTQNDVLCAIDIVSDRQTGDVHSLDVDWFFQLKSRTDGGPLQQRRERVEVKMKKIKGKWEIFGIEPLKILSPETGQ